MSQMPVISEHYSLHDKNTLRLASCAEYFATFTSSDELAELVRWAEQKSLAIRVLGGGSNVLMPEFVPGLVIQSKDETVSVVSEDENSVVIDVAAGKCWHDWVVESIQYGHGLENLALIPGSVGASPVQNIGAYGVEVSDLLVSVTGFSIAEQRMLTIEKADCDFSYRDSVFKHRLKNNFVICSVRFRLNKFFSPNLEYAPLNSLEPNALSAQDLIDFVVGVRSAKLPDPGLIPNAGSFFKNPIVSTETADDLKNLHPTLPVYPVHSAPQSAKLAAGWLIEQCGFKGKAYGPVAMYEKQALVLTAPGEAELQDVARLQSLVQTEVESRFGVHLEPEPQLFTD